MRMMILLSTPESRRTGWAITVKAASVIRVYPKEQTNDSFSTFFPSLFEVFWRAVHDDVGFEGVVEDAVVIFSM